MAIAINVKPSSGAGKAQSLVLQKGVNKIHVSAGDALQLADTLSQQLPADAVMQRSADTLIIEIPSQGIRAELDGFYVADASGAGATIEFPALDAGSQVSAASFGAESLSSLTLDAASGGASGGNGGGSAHPGISTTGLVIGGVLVAGAAAAAASGSSSKTTSVAVPVPVPTPVPVPVPAPAPAPLAVTAVTSSVTSVNEGNAVVFSIATNQTSATPNNTISYTLSGTGLTPADVAGGQLTGTATIGADGVATVQVTLLNDATTEGAETLVLTAAGKASSAVTINDTSLTPVAGPIVLQNANDTLVGGAGDDVFSAPDVIVTTTGVDTFVNTLAALDSLDGGNGNDVLNIVSNNATLWAAGAPSPLTIKNIETVNINTVGSLGAGVGGGGANVQVDVSKWTGLTALNVTNAGVTNLKGATTTAFTVNSSSTVGIDTASTIAVTGSKGQVTLASATGAVSLVNDQSTVGAVLVTGGSTVNVTETNAATGTVTIGDSGYTKIATDAITLTVSAKKDATNTGAIEVYGSKAVTVTQTSNIVDAGSATGGTIKIGNSIATKDSPAGAISVTNTIASKSSYNGSAAATQAAVTTYGGSTVLVDSSKSTSAGTSGSTAYNVTQNAVNVNGSSLTTFVTVNQAAVVQGNAKSSATAAVTETGRVAFTSLAIGDSVTVGGLTLTATAAMTDAEVAAAFANLAAGATRANTTKGTSYGYLTGFSAGAADAYSSVIFTSSAAGNVFDLAASGTGAASAVAATDKVQGGAAVAATAAVGYMSAGVVTITDSVNTAGLASSITTASLSNYAATSSVKSSALSTLTLAGIGGTLSIDGANTTQSRTLALNVNSLTADVITDTQNHFKTINVTTAGTASKIAGIADTGATALTVTGTAALTLTTASGLSNLQTVTVTGSGGFTTAALAATVTSVDASGTSGNVTVNQSAAGMKYLGGSGVDTVTLSAYATATVDGGAGTGDTLIINADYLTPTLSTHVVPTGFELLKTTAAATYANVAGFASVTNAATGTTVYSNASVGEQLIVAGTGATTTWNLAIGGGLSDAVTVNIANTAASSDTITLTGVELVTVNVNNTTGLETLTLADATATKITLAGTSSVSLTNSSVGATVDATNLSGGLTYSTAGTFAGTVTGGAGVDNLTAAGSVAVTLKGNDGNDTLTSNAVGNTLYGGNGSDTFVLVAATSTATAAVTTVADAATGDRIQLANNGTETWTATGKTAIAAPGLNLAAAADLVSASLTSGAGAGQVVWFQYGGDTYILEHNTAGTAYAVGDVLVRLSGAIDLSTAGFVNTGGVGSNAPVIQLG